MKLLILFCFIPFGIYAQGGCAPPIVIGRALDVICLYNGNETIDFANPPNAGESYQIQGNGVPLGTVDLLQKGC